MQGLQRVNQHTRNVTALFKNVQGPLRKVLQGVGLPRWQRITRTGLNVLPPAMIGTTKTNQMRPFGSITGDSNSLHHRLGTRHVKAHLIEPRDDPQTLDDLKDHRVIRTEHRPQVSDTRNALGNRFFVKIITKNIDAV